MTNRGCAMPQTVVVPIALPGQDPDRISLAATPVAKALAERNGSTVVLVSAVDVIPTFDPLTRTLVIPMDEVRIHLLENARSMLTDIATRFPDSQVKVEVRWGHAVEVINSVVAAAEDPIVVMASHARHGLRRILRGSVASQLVNEATCPVIVVRGTGPADPLPSDPSFGTLVAPLDRSPFAEHAVEAGLSALERPDLRVHLLHVVEPIAFPASAREEVFTFVRPSVEHYLNEFATRLLSRGYRVTIEVRQGQPVEQINQAVDEQEADLVVMATHGLTGLGRRLLGSTAERLLAGGTVPLLLVRPDRESVVAARKRAAEEAAVRTEELHEPHPALWDLRVDSLMTAPAIAADRETPLAEIVETMLAEDIGCVPIVDNHNRLVGIVTESDFIGDGCYVPLAAYQVPRCFQIHLTEAALEHIYAAGRELTADQIMSHPVVTVTEDEPVGAVVAKMRGRNVKRVPVVRGGAPVGVISRHDLLKLLIPPQESATSTSPAAQLDG